jgi:hypothetical protein
MSGCPYGSYSDNHMKLNKIKQNHQLGIFIAKILGEHPLTAKNA